MLSAVSLVAHLLEPPDCLSGVNLNKVKYLYEMLLKHACLSEVLSKEHVVTQLPQIMDDLQQDEGLSSRTGHTACTKSSRLYLDQMNQLKTNMSIEEFTKYTSQGYWTIRRSNRFWSGNVTDQTIEQVLVRMLKSPSRRSSARSWCHTEHPIKNGANNSTNCSNLWVI